MSDALRTPTARQIAWARVEVKAARKAGHEPDPEAVRFAGFDLYKALESEDRARR